MTLRSTGHGYGAAHKALHWGMLALFVFQYAVAAVMLSLGPQDTALGYTQANAYNWHKSVGLLALVLAQVRVGVRRASRLPPWAPTLSTFEKALIHRYERVLYTGMLLMPASGFVYVMAGDYGVHLFEALHLPNPIGKREGLALIAKWVHVTSAYVILAALGTHVGLVLRHQLVLRDGLLWRMWPGWGG